MSDNSAFKKQINPLVANTLLELQSRIQIMVNELGSEVGAHRDLVEKQLKSHLADAFMVCNTQDEAKLLYRAFALELHPDSQKPFMDNISKIAPTWRAAFVPALKEVYTSYNNHQLTHNTYRQGEQTFIPLSAQKKDNHLNLSIYEKICKIIFVSLKNRSENTEYSIYELFDTLTQKEFPEFYQYRRYDMALQYIIYWSAFSINTFLVGAVLIKEALRPFPLFWIENRLLEYIFGDNKAALELAYTKAYQDHMLYEENQRVDASLDNFKTTVMAHFLQTPESQKAFLLEKFYSHDELDAKVNKNLPILPSDRALSTEEQQLRAQLIQAEEKFIFQKEFIKLSLIHNKLDEITKTIPAQLMQKLQLLYEDKQLRDLDDIADKKLIADCFDIVCHYCDKTNHNIYHSAQQLRGLDHLNALLESLKVYCHRDDVPWLTRLLHGIVFLLTAPLTLIHLGWDALSETLDAVCCLIKITFTYLVNAPLAFYDAIKNKEEEPILQKPSTNNHQAPLEEPTTRPESMASEKKDATIGVAKIGLFGSSAPKPNQTDESSVEEEQDREHANKNSFGID